MRFHEIQFQTDAESEGFGPAHLLPGNKHDDGRRKNWPSPPVIIFCTISEFPYMLIRFLLHSSLVKSDNEIGKFSY